LYSLKLLLDFAEPSPNYIFATRGIADEYFYSAGKHLVKLENVYNKIRNEYQ